VRNPALKEVEFVHQEQGGKAGECGKACELTNGMLEPFTGDEQRKREETLKKKRILYRNGSLEANGVSIWKAQGA